MDMFTTTVPQSGDEMFHLWAKLLQAFNTKYGITNNPPSSGDQIYDVIKKLLISANQAL